MSYRITLIPGDGIGPEVVYATRRVLEATGVIFDWEVVNAGEGVMAEFGTPLPASVLEFVRRNKVALKGPVTTPVGSGFRSVNVALRRELDLYACVRPCKSYEGIASCHEKVDIVVIRENTEDLYAGLELDKGTSGIRSLLKMFSEANDTVTGDDAAISLKIISESASRRIVKFAFNYALANRRKKVTAVHKANIMKSTDGLFLSVAREVAGNYPDIEFNDVIVDNLCMQLVRNPERFDVLVMPNLYGDIVSDLCAGLIGGLGIAPGANIGDDLAVFEPTHGSAPKYAGLNKVNPMATTLSGVMMLRYLGENGAADMMENAIAEVIAEGKSLTYDLNPEATDKAVGTSQVADAIIEKMKG